MEFRICDKRQSILASNDHILVEGGPGSGKTTIALLKARRIVDDKQLKTNQKVLFLSFARATISRVEQQATHLLTLEHKRAMEINTYHGFAWSLIQTYGPLLIPHLKFKLITPPALASKLAGAAESEATRIKIELLKQEGVICFDLFGETAAKILERSKSIREIMSTAYPYIIVDEFQDTDANEWKIIQLLGEKSKIIALADLDQRIYEFRGASVTRIPEFNSIFLPEKVNLGKENNRSSDTDIVQFGDDLLTGANKGKKYQFVKIVRYPYYKGDHSRIPLLSALSDSRRRLRGKSGKDWSIAILVRAKLDTLTISSYLTAKNISHEVLIDPAGPALAASAIATVLEPPKGSQEQIAKILRKVIDHIRGRKGDKPSKADLELASALEGFLLTGIIRGSKRKAIVEELYVIESQRQNLQLKGIPEDDWLLIRKLFQDAHAECLKNVYEDARYLSLLHKGAILSRRLGESWREFRGYTNALQAVEDALTQEHFSMANREWKGIFIMNIHKCKGKEFDEVIVWEEYRKPIVYNNHIAEARLLMRVAVTRARSFCTVLTPAIDPCVLL